MNNTINLKKNFYSSMISVLLLGFIFIASILMAKIDIKTLQAGGVSTGVFFNNAPATMVGGGG